MRIMPSSDDSWRKRQAAIRELIAKEPIGSQGLLLRRLAARGFRVTQPSVSRDLQELQVVKTAGRYQLLARLTAAEPPASSELAEAGRAIRRFRCAGPNLVVVNTPPGRASAVAVAIDREGWPEVVGTVAGDDTLFLAVTGRQGQSRLEQRLNKLIKEK
jgi:transcriptional regulator of arginine metabolism